MRDAERGRTGCILLAEDNPVSQAVAGAMLANLGFDVDVVADGAESVTAATRTPYQAILMDCQLPVLDGYQAATEIRRLQAGTRRTPIIAVTAAPMTRERALAAGIDDELTKPFSVKALAAVLARWIPRGSHRTAAHAHAKTLAAIQLGLAEVAEGARPVLDPRVLSGLERLGAAAGEDLVGQLATLFLADAGLRIAGLREALAGHDPAAVAWSAHLLSGASANVGAAELARLCAAFATAGAAGDLTSGSVHLESVEAELDRVRVALRSSVGAP